MDTTGFLLALFLGWCGGYRFYKKQYGLGVLYLFTGGLFGIGWLVDIIVSLSGKSKKRTVKTTPIYKTISNEKRTYDPVDTSSFTTDKFHTKVVGVTYETTQGIHMKRQDVIRSMVPGDTLSLEYYTYDGDPAYRVVLDRNNADIGNLNAKLAKDVYNNYKDSVIEISDWEVTGGDDGKSYGCNIELNIF